MPKKADSIVSTLLGLVRGTSLVSLDLDGRSRPEEAPPPEPDPPREPLVSRLPRPLPPPKREPLREPPPKKQEAPQESFWSPFPEPVTAISRDTRCEVEAFLGGLDQVRATDAYLALPAEVRSSIDRAQHDLLSALYCSSDGERIRAKFDELKQAVTQAAERADD